MRMNIFHKKFIGTTGKGALCFIQFYNVSISLMSGLVSEKIFIFFQRLTVAELYDQVSNVHFASLWG